MDEVGNRDENTVIKLECFLKTTEKRAKEMIQTASDKQKEDRKIDFGMSKCSKWMIGHDNTVSLNVNLPSLDEIENDIKYIENYIKEINSRGRRNQKRREAMLSSEITKIG